ncbi:MAG TPA: hypothetical protein VE197_22965, partial [Mycobacterium sp.]|nr:hypothetical protein [Mycobacterium sp.]
MGGTAVGTGDGVRDGEPQSGAAAGAGAVGSGEPVKGMREKLLREAVAAVGDVKLQPPVGLECGEADRSCPVAQRVVHQRRESLADPDGVAVDAVRRAAGDDELSARDTRAFPKRLRGLLKEFTGGHQGLVEWELALLRARQDEELFGEGDDA